MKYAVITIKNMPRNIGNYFRKTNTNSRNLDSTNLTKMKRKFKYVHDFIFYIVLKIKILQIN